VFIDGRKQVQNKKKALRILSAKVNKVREEAEQSKHDKNRSSQMGGGSRSGKIRTYNFIKSRVTDHRLGTKTRQIDQVMRGGFDLVIQE